MAIARSHSFTRRAGLIGGAALLLAGCEQDAAQQVKSLKTQVQDRFGAKDFAKGYELATKGLALARGNLGDKHADTLYLVQAVSENAVGLKNWPMAMRALKQELDLRSKAGQPEQKLQRRRTLLIKLAEENGDKTTAIDQSVIIAKAIEMTTGKDPQPTYRPEDSSYPAELYRQRVEGDVELGYNLDASGTPQSVRVIRSTPRDAFDAAALENFRRWRFTPMIENGQAVSSTGHHFTLAFRMQKERPPTE